MQISKQRRAQAVAGALAFTQGTPLQAGPYERLLLNEYVRGCLTIEQVERLVALATQGAPPTCPPLAQ